MPNNLCEERDSDVLFIGIKDLLCYLHWNKSNVLALTPVVTLIAFGLLGASLFVCFFLKKIFIVFMKDTQRERQRHRQRETQAPRREPDADLDPRTLGSHAEPKADTQPLSHPGAPFLSFLIETLNRTSIIAKGALSNIFRRYCFSPSSIRFTFCRRGRQAMALGLCEERADDS